MAKDKFNPDAYLQSKGKFDPEAYLSGRNAPPTSVAAQSSTSVASPSGKQGESNEDGVLTKLAHAFAPTLSPVTPLQRAEGIGTALEIGLPFFSTLFSGGASIPAAGALAGLGTLAKESLVEAAGGPASTVEDKLKSAGASAAFGVVGQAAGVGAGKLFAKAKAPLAAYVEPQSLAAAKAAGIDYLPSEVLKESAFAPSVVQGVERVMGSTVTGGAVLNPLRTGRLAALRKYASSEIDRAITVLDDPTTVKKLAEGGLEATRTEFRNASGRLFRQLDNAAVKIPSKTTTTKVPSKILSESGVPFTSDVTKEIPRAVDITMTKRFVNGIISKLPEDVRVAIGKGGGEVADFYKQLKAIADLPDNIRFEDAAFYRSQLLATVRQSGEIINKRDIGLANKLAGSFDSRARLAAKQAGILPEYEAANKFYAEGVQKFQNTFIKKLADAEPGKLAQELFKPNNAESIKEIRAAIGDAAFQKLKRQGTENWLESALKFDTSGDQSLAAKPLLDAWKNLGKESKNVLFTAGEQQEVGNIVETLSKFSTKHQNPGLWGLTQIVTGSGLIGAGEIGASGTILVGPYILAKMMSSQTGRKWLTEGFKVQPGTKEAINFMGRFGAWLTKENASRRDGGK